MAEPSWSLQSRSIVSSRFHEIASTLEDPGETEVRISITVIHYGSSSSAIQRALEIAPLGVEHSYRLQEAALVVWPPPNGPMAYVECRFVPANCF